MHGGRDERRSLRSARRRLRIVLPFGLIAISLWLLVGCLYIPTGNNLHLTGTKKDFRSLVGESGSPGPIIAGAISRERVERLLGPPPFESDDHRRAMYVLHVKKGIAIWPACFTATDYSDTGIGLVLVYDLNGRLIHWNRIEAPGGFNAMLGPYGIPAGQAVQDKLDDSLISQANDSPTTQYSDQSALAERWRIKAVKR